MKTGETLLHRLLDVDPQVGEAVEQERHSKAKPDEHAGEQVGDDHGDQGDTVSSELPDPVTPELPDGVPVHQLVSDNHEHACQARNRDEAQRTLPESGEEEDPQTMEDRRQPYA